MIIGIFLFSFISFTILTLIDSACYIPKLDDPAWIYRCDGEYYKTYWDVRTICKRKNPNARVFMIRKDSIFKTSTYSPTRIPPFTKPTPKTMMPILPTKKPTSKINIQELRKEYLDMTNMYRRRHGSPDLINSPKLENLAQDYAEKLARKFDGKLIHDPNKRYGENLAFVPLSLIHDPVKYWYNEIRYYNFKRPGFGYNTGHFTQVVWKNTREMGCGIAKVNEKYSGYYIISCKYNPSGNYLNQFEQNVLAPKN